MANRLLTVTFDAHDPARLARFWGHLLDRKPTADGDIAVLPGTDTQVGLRFAPAPAGEARADALHLHLTSSSPADQQHTVATALGLGASHHDVGQRPEEGHIVLADPEGNEFCVIEPGNAYLAGCGPLGEVACDGDRAVGLFWSDALGWPLVWDQDRETAIQSPHGGTKVAWGGPPEFPKAQWNRQRFHLVMSAGGAGIAAGTAGDRRVEVDRLLALGATRLETGADGGVVLADPGGSEFTVDVI